MENEKITLELTYDEWNTLQNYAVDSGLTAAEIVAQFVSDLTRSDRSGDTLSRLYANVWLERQHWWKAR